MMQGPKLHRVLICLVVVVYFGDFSHVGFEIGSTKRKKNSGHTLRLPQVKFPCSRDHIDFVFPSVFDKFVIQSSHEDIC
jgi:hypothetical protein